MVVFFVIFWYFVGCFVRSFICGYAAWKYNTWWVISDWIISPIHWWQWTPAQYGQWYERNYDLDGNRTTECWVIRIGRAIIGALYGPESHSWERYRDR